MHAIPGGRCPRCGHEPTPDVSQIIAAGGDLVDVAEHLEVDPVEALNRLKAIDADLARTAVANRKVSFTGTNMLEELRDICETLLAQGLDVDAAARTCSVSRQTIRRWLVTNGMEDLYIALMRNRPRQVEGGPGRPRVYTR
jgi:hypothetical protein